MSLIDEDKNFNDREVDTAQSKDRDIGILEELKQIREGLDKLLQYLHIITGEKL